MDRSKEIHIVDMFWTFQGEGHHAGRRSLFVRMPKCNLSCPWCDTEFDKFERRSTDDLRRIAQYERARFAVITGGEPLAHRHTGKVIRVLKELGFYIAVETNGTMPPRNGIDWYTCSPKAQAKYEVHPALWENVDEFKYVVEHGFDWRILKRHGEAMPGPGYPLLSLSPEYGRMKEAVCEIQRFLAVHPNWRMSLQTHKWVGAP